MSETRSDAELLGLIARGDVRAVGELYDRHGATLFPIALRIVRDRSEAEDVVHDAFVAVSERAGQYAPERGTVIAWLVTLVRNLSIDRTRRRERRGALAREVLPHEPPASVRDPERLTSEASEREKIRRALLALPDVQRQTLEVAFFEGLSYPEIAARENVPLGTIKSRAARALAALREALVKEGVSLDALVSATPAATSGGGGGGGGSGGGAGA
jgi:RNA polymerase sigma-70 factor (ECF subfamily)